MSSAVNYANLYVGILKLMRILPNSIDNLLFYSMYINNIISVWKPKKLSQTWKNLMAMFNNYGFLKWESPGLVCTKQKYCR